ncbi:hypothetical protein DKM19_22900 [Streptosporangium sp. 'caverna']|nr:hypothetical protein DKM19_22900 [Streptosporangium sp. 'caverna']
MRVAGDHRGEDSAHLFQLITLVAKAGTRATTYRTGTVNVSRGVGLDADLGVPAGADRGQFPIQTGDACDRRRSAMVATGVDLDLRSG